jgi:hypothetical protein
MESELTFTLAENQRLFSISRGVPASEVEEIYFTTVEEAVLSIFHSAPTHWTKTAANWFEYQLRVYSVRTPLLISERAPQTLRQIATAGDPNERAFGQNLRQQCSMNATGYWVEVPVELPNGIDDNDNIVVAEMSNRAVTGFILCSPGSLLLIRNLDLKIPALLKVLMAKKEQFREQGLELNLSKLADMIRDTISRQPQAVLEIIPMDAPRVSELPSAAGGTGLTPGLPLFNQQSVYGNLSPLSPSRLLYSPPALSPVLSPQDADFQSSQFDILPRDLIVYMATGMGLDAIQNFCRTSKRFNELICDNEQFWAAKLSNEFPTDFKAKPENMSYREFYQRMWFAANDPDGILEQVLKIQKGFNTVQLVGILMALSSRRKQDIAAGIPDRREIVDYVLGLIGLQRDGTDSRHGIMDYDGWLSSEARHNLNYPFPLFADPKVYNRDTPPNRPLNEAARKLEAQRGIIYDAVANYLASPVLIQWLENPPAIDAIGGPIQPKPWSRIRAILDGMGLKTRAFAMSTDPAKNALISELYKQAFYRMWKLTKRDVEPNTLPVSAATSRSGVPQ